MQPSTDGTCFTMKTSKPLERRAFLVSTAAVVANAAACSDDGGTIPAAPSDGGATESEAGRTEEPTAAADAAVSTPNSTSSVDASQSTEPTSTSSEATDVSQGSSSSPDASADGGDSSSASSSEPVADASSSGSASTGETSSGTSADTSSEQSSEPLSTNDACFEGGGTDGGTSDDAGAGVLCSTNTFNGDHCHPLTVPLSDVSRHDYVTYILEDGGTGHTHTLALSAYDFLLIEPGVSQTFQSSFDAGHSHACIITCGE